LPPIRVLLAGLPQLLHDIIASALGQEADIVLLDDGWDPSSRSGQPDVLVIGVRPGEATARCTEVLASHPQLTVVAIEVDGRRAFLGERRPSISELGQIDPETLLRVVVRGRRVDPPI
jgi:hypothetical protein